MEPLVVLWLGVISKEIDTFFRYLSSASNMFRSKGRVSYYVCLSYDGLSEKLPGLRLRLVENNIVEK